MQTGPSRQGAWGLSSKATVTAPSGTPSVSTGGCGKVSVPGEGLSLCPQVHRGPESSAGSEPLNLHAGVPTRGWNTSRGTPLAPMNS